MPALMPTAALAAAVALAKQELGARLAVRGLQMMSRQPVQQLQQAHQTVAAQAYHFHQPFRPPLVRRYCGGGLRDSSHVPGHHSVSRKIYTCCQKYDVLRESKQAREVRRRRRNATAYTPLILPWEHKQWRTVWQHRQHRYK